MGRFRPTEARRALKILFAWLVSISLAVLAGLLSDIPTVMRLAVAALLLSQVASVLPFFRGTSTVKVVLLQIAAASLITPLIPRGQRYVYCACAAALILLAHSGSWFVEQYRKRVVQHFNERRNLQLSADTRHEFLGSTLESRGVAFYGLLPGLALGLIVDRLFLQGQPYPQAFTFLLILYLTGTRSTRRLVTVRPLGLDSPTR